MNVIEFDKKVDVVELSVEDVISRNKNVFDDVIMLGWDKEGYMFFDMTNIKLSEVIYLLELMKKEILEGAYSHGD